MEIQKDCVVSFHYRLSNSGGTELETSRNGDPVAYLHGHRGVIRGLEEAMLGFIGQAKGPEYSLRAAVYEFSERDLVGGNSRNSIRH